MPIGNRVGYHNNLVKGISRQGRDISRDKYIETSRDFYSRLVVSMMSFFSPSWWGGGSFYTLAHLALFVGRTCRSRVLPGYYYYWVHFAMPVDATGI